MEFAKKHGYYACIEVNSHFDEGRKVFIVDFTEEQLHILYKLVSGDTKGAKPSSKRGAFNISKGVTTFYKVNLVNLAYDFSEIESLGLNINILDPSLQSVYADDSLLRADPLIAPGETTNTCKQ